MAIHKLDHSHIRTKQQFKVTGMSVTTEENDSAVKFAKAANEWNIPRQGLPKWKKFLN